MNRKKDNTSTKSVQNQLIVTKRHPKAGIGVRGRKQSIVEWSAEEGKIILTHSKHDLQVRE